MTDEMKEYIDGMSYEKMLFMWRRAPAGDPLFCSAGKAAAYFAKVMEEKKQLDPAAAVAASKSIGW
jgi:hypothetical protein